MKTNISLSKVSEFLACEQATPFDLLGPHQIEHKGQKGISVRAFLPSSQQAWILDTAHKSSSPMRKVHPSGLFEGIVPLSQDQTPELDYQLRFTNQDGGTTTMNDPYRFKGMLSDLDMHLFGEGNHTKIYEKLGAQIRTIGEVTGVNFAVWAPNARAISLIGDFNGWDGRRHPMQQKDGSGIWELFVPDLKAGEKYKYRIRDCNGNHVDKADPYGFACELPPQTASIVTDLSNYQWSDQDWIAKRASQNPIDQPISVYELHLGSWKRKWDGQPWMNYRDIAHHLVKYCQQMNFTHVELMPITEHPFTGSWGYQSLGYFAATRRYGTPEDFMYFVDYCHQHGIGVILDWVPAHFPKDEFGLARFDGSALYEHADPRQGEHPDWGTLIFNYGRNEVRNFLMASASFWIDKYHIDGLRVDAVASMLYLDYSREEGGWIPNKYGSRENLEAIDFLKQFNEHVHGEFPGVMTLAEESTSWTGVSRPTFSGGLGFTFKWNMGWMNDTLDYMRRDPIHRKFHHDDLTFSLIYAFTENFMLPFSHDEVVHGKGSLMDQMPGDLWQKNANLRLLYSYMWSHPGKKLLFMGNEFGQWKEFDEEEQIQWDLMQWESHSGIQKLVSDLNRLYRDEPALHQLDSVSEGFEWVDCHNSDASILIYLRKAKDSGDFVLVCNNFTPSLHASYKVGVPGPGHYREIFNSDSEYYGGSNNGNGGVNAQQVEAQGRQWSIDITVPPLATCMFKLG